MLWRFLKRALPVIGLAVVAGFIASALGLPLIVGALAVLGGYGIWHWAKKQKENQV